MTKDEKLKQIQSIANNPKGEILLSDLYLDYKSSDLSKDLTEDQIRKNVTDIYTKVHSSFSASSGKVNDHFYFSVNDFLDNVMGRLSRASMMPRKYDVKTVNNILEVPYKMKDELLRLSMYFYIRTQEYKGIIEYKSGMLTYSNIVRPTNMDFDEDSYYKNLQFSKDYNIESKFGKATKKLVRDDVYFAYEISDNSGKNYIWKELPSEYCTILGRDRFETYRVGFDMSYFLAYPQYIDSYPTEFKEKFNDYSEKRKKRMTEKNVTRKLLEIEGLESIYELDNNRAIAFKFDESIDYVLPFYSAMFLDMIRLAELKDVEILSEVSDNYKLIHQLIPMDKEGKGEDEFLISGEYLDGFHDNLRKNVPKDVGVATTPMPLTAINLKSNVASAGDGITQKYVSNLLTQSGTSALLFNGASTSSLGLNKNIQVDENMMFKVLRQYELFMNKRLFLYNKGSYNFSLQFLNHTHFNTEELYNRLFKAGQYGLNTEFEVGAVIGVKQIDLIQNANIMEKLGLKSKFIPFQSSHVGDASTKETGNKTTENNLTDDGMKSRERDL